MSLKLWFHTVLSYLLRALFISVQTHQKPPKLQHKSYKCGLRSQTTFLILALVCCVVFVVFYHLPSSEWAWTWMRSLSSGEAASRSCKGSVCKHAAALVAVVLTVETVVLLQLFTSAQMYSACLKTRRLAECAETDRTLSPCSTSQIAVKEKKESRQGSFHVYKC